METGDRSLAVSCLSDEDRAQLLVLLEPERAATLLETMPDAQAVDAVEDIPAEEAARIIEELPPLPAAVIAELEDLGLDDDLRRTIGLFYLYAADTGTSVGTLTSAQADYFDH